MPSHHLNYTGHWEFLLAESTLQIRVPDGVALEIEHDGTRFHLERTLEFADRGDTFAIDLIIAGENAPNARGDATLHPSLQWESGDLLFTTRIVRGDEQGTNVVRHVITYSGTTLVAKESFRGFGQDYDNPWVLRKC